MDARVSDVATRGDLAELRHEMQVGFATLETRFERRVGAVAMLARALR